MLRAGLPVTPEAVAIDIDESVALRLKVQTPRDPNAFFLCG